MRHAAAGWSAEPKLERPDSLRVLMVTTEWEMPGLPRSGTFIKRQAEFVKRAGVELEVFTFDGQKNPYNYLRAWARLQHRLLTERFDLIHAQFGQSGLLAFPKRIPLVVTFRGSDALGIVRDSDGGYTRVGRLLQHASRFVARHADAVIVVAPHLGAQLGTKAPVHVIPSGIDFTEFTPIPQAQARQQLGLDGDDRLVLFVGRPGQARKRHALARQAVELLNQRMPARLVVAWQVPHEQIPVYMSACDVLVFTSMQEGSPNVVKEALACDLPVVSVAVGDVPDRLRGVDGCEVCPDDEPKTIAAALERALARGGRINGRAAVSHLDERLLTNQVLGVYRSVLAGRHVGISPAAEWA
ncbi:MAG: glycosyltransferase [Gemmatimonadales bacterium]